MPYVPAEVQQEMRKRTWWGKEMQEDPQKITDPAKRNLFWYAPDI